MPVMSQNISMMQDPDFQKCGDIMVAPKRNTFAMSCLHCEAIFTRLPAFMRHLHQRHIEQLQFEPKDAEVEVYAVEELVSRALCAGEGDSEESGLADEDFNISENDEEEDERIRNLFKKGKKKVNGKERNPTRNIVKEATLGNLSILNALEDCDVSLNFVENIDNTIIVDKQENEIELKGDEYKENKFKENDAETDAAMTMIEEDFDMDSTIIKRIKMDLEMESDDMVESMKDNYKKFYSIKDLKKDIDTNDNCNSSTEDEDENVTLTEHNISKSLKASPSNRVSGLKNLLSGLDDLDDVDDLLENIEDSMVSKHQEESKREEGHTSPEILGPRAENDVDLDEHNLNASILKQCLADDDADDGKDEKQASANLSKSDTEKTEIGHMSALQLQVMADWDLDDIDLEDCLNNENLASGVAENTSDAGKGDNDMEVTPKSSKECTEYIEISRTPKTRESSLEYVASKENTTRSPKLVKRTPKSSKNLKKNKVTPKSQKTPETQMLSFAKKETDILEENVSGAMEVDVTPRTKKGRGESKAAADTPKSMQKTTPKSTKTIKNCDQNTPKTRKSVPSKNTSEEKDIQVENKTHIENIEKELLAKDSQIIIMDEKESKITQNSRKLGKLSNGGTPRTAEDEKEFETNKFEEGLSEDKSSTRMYEQNTESPEEFSLQSFLSKSLDDEDLDTLINQLETKVYQSISDTNKIERPKESEHPNNQYAIQDNEEVSLEDDMAIFRKFIGLDSYETKEEDKQCTANEEEKYFKANEQKEHVKDTKGEQQYNANEEDEEFEVHEEKQQFKSEDEEKLKSNEEEQEYKNNEEEEQLEANEEVEQFKANEEEQEKANEEEEQFEANEEEERFKANEEEQFEDNEEEEQFKAIEDEEHVKGNKEEEQHKDNEEDDVDDFENLLNEDLSKALENALGEDNADLLKLSEDECYLKANDENEMPASIEFEKKKSHHKKKTLSTISLNTNGQEHFESKYIKTNRRARNVKGKQVKVLGGTQQRIIHNALIPKLSNKRQKRAPRIIKDNQKALLHQKLYEKNSKSVQSPKKYKESQENCPIKINAKNTSKTDFEVEHQQHQLQIIKFKKETVTPSRCFINMQRGERTPMKLNDLFLKNSPKTHEKTEEKTGNALAPTTPAKKIYKKSPSECKKNLNKTTPPTASTTQSTTKISPKNTIVSKQIGKPSSIALHANSHYIPTTDVRTPQKLRNLSIKLQRCPSQLAISKSSDNLTSSEYFNSPPKRQEIQSSKTSPLSALEIENLTSAFKLPNGITISKVNPNTSPKMVDVTPSKSNYCKQNFTEQQLVGLQCTLPTESLINSLPASLTVTKTRVSLASRLRVRQASIDIVPPGKSPKKCSLDYKSYAVNRSARKKDVLQRMRNIKKKIFKSIESNSLANSKLVKSPLIKKRKRSTILIESFQILPNVADEVLTPLLEAQHSPPQLSTAQHLLEQTTPKSIMDGNILKSNVSPLKPDKEKSSPRTSTYNEERKSAGTTPTHIMDDKSSYSTQIVSISCEKTLKSAKKTKSPESSPKQTKDIQSTPPKNCMNAAKTPSTGKRGRPAKRRATSPIEGEERSKRLHKSPIKQEKFKKATELEAAQLGLSESCVAFLQRDSRIDSILDEHMPVDDNSLDKTPKKTQEQKNTAKLKDIEIEPKPSASDQECNTADTNILDDLLEQVTSEDTPDANKDAKQKEMSAKYNIVQDYTDSKDLELLEIVGLKIINATDVEDFYNEEEVEEMRANAHKFADVCKQFLRIFSNSKQTEPLKLLRNMRTTVNSIFKNNFTINDIKRLVNLVVIWYTNCYNNKLIEKKPLLESTNYYLLAFNFIPKTSRRTYYCEFCDDNFNTEHKYYTHRINHTGAHYPYSCKNCPVGFSRPQYLKTHQSICVKRNDKPPQLTVANKTQQKVLKPTGNDDNKVSISKLEYTNAVKSEHVNREKVTVKRTEVKKNSKSENVSKNHVLRRLHTVYKCAKCEMSFATESDVKLHINSCNRNLRRQPKNCTPRPKPKAEPYSKNN